MPCNMLSKALLDAAFAAIGEIGLDFYWDRSFEKEQYHAFHQQIEWAQEFGLTHCNSFTGFYGTNHCCGEGTSEWKPARYISLFQ